METKVKQPETVYQIIDKKSGRAQGVYSRGYGDEYDFSSVSSARSANVHNIYQDKNQYRIAKYRVTYELIEEDCDNAGMDYELTDDEKFEKEMEGKEPLLEYNDMFPLLVRVNKKWKTKRAHKEIGTMLTKEEINQLLSVSFYEALGESILPKLGPIQLGEN